MESAVPAPADGSTALDFHIALDAGVRGDATRSLNDQLVGSDTVDMHLDVGPPLDGASSVDGASMPDAGLLVDAHVPRSPCDGLADGAVLSHGDFGPCEYDTPCAQRGTRSRRNVLCEDGQGMEREEITQDGCDRETEGMVVHLGDYDGDCIYGDICSLQGTQSRINQVCFDGLAIESIETRPLEMCQRITDGTPCGEGGFECLAGACACPLAMPEPCGERCVDVSRDRQHCGACDQVCARGQLCVASQCIDACGNGMVDVAAGETCDDGNDHPMDGCHRCQEVAADFCVEQVCDPSGTHFQYHMTSIAVPHPMGRSRVVPGVFPRLGQNIEFEGPGNPPPQAPVQPGFGTAVALDGDWALVGAPDGLSSADMGDVYFFRRVDGVWQPHTRLTVDPGRPSCVNDCQDFCFMCAEIERMCDDLNFSDEECDLEVPPECRGREHICGQNCYRGIGRCANSHQLGSKIALAGERAVLWSWHSYSSEFEYEYDPMLYVYRLIDDVWTPTGTLWPDGFLAEREWGNSIAMDGETIVTGTRNSEDEALVFEIIDGQWVQSALLGPGEQNMWVGFGRSVDISRHRIVVGAWRGQGAYIFSRDQNGWQQETRLTRDNLPDDARFGWRVAIDNDTVVVGFSHANHPTVVFEYVEGQWQETQELEHGGPIDLDGDTLVIDGRWVYRRQGGSFSLTAFIDPTVVPEFSMAHVSGEFLLYGHPQADLESDESGTATMMKLPVPLCMAGGQCVCLVGASGDRCQERPACGDGQQQAAEACDDGNLDTGDGCSDHCLIEAP